MTPPDRAAPPWWKRAVVYQIYPRTFMDSDGDGVGDLRGIASRLNHLTRLGVDAVWLSPHFDSPDTDNGYDIRDYRKVMAEFGDMADFDALLAAMTARGLRLILDLVVNHTSDEHAWFVQSRSGRSNPYRDFYIWRDGRDGGPPNNYPSFFGGPAWSYDQPTRQWYLHLFGAKQPDLNWDNPQVRLAVHEIMRFWLDKGVAAFRMDVIAFVSKPAGLPDLTAEGLKAPEYAYTRGPRLHAHLRELRQVLAPYDAVAVGEAFGVTPQQARDLTDERRGELDMALNFDIVRCDRDGWRKRPFSLPAMKALYRRLDADVGEHGWNSVFLENHDNPRAVSHFGDDDPAWVERSAKTLATLLLTQRGTPFVYQGQEIGMTNSRFTGIEDHADIEAKGQWRDWVQSGRVDAVSFLRDLAETSRDNARTPMQWSATAQAGFSSGDPSPAANANHAEINVEAQEARPQSVLAFYRRLIALRRATPDLVDGDYEDLAPDHPHLFAIRRGEIYVVTNFSRATGAVNLPAALFSTLISTDLAQTALSDARVSLGGWQSLILRKDGGAEG